MSKAKKSSHPPNSVLYGRRPGDVLRKTSWRLRE